MVKLSSSPKSIALLSIEVFLSNPFLCRNGMIPGSWWLCDLTKGFTRVRSSSLAGLIPGLPCRELPLGVFRCMVADSPSLDLLRIGLMLGLLCVCARARAVLLGATDFFAVAAGVFSGVIDGVTFFAPGRLAYGSAVAGLVNSGRGRIGLRTVPPISEPVPVEVEASADFDDPPDRADGGRAVEDAVDALEAVLEPRDFADNDFTGE